MSRLKFLTACLMAVMSCAVFTACGGDDNGPLPPGSEGGDVVDETVTKESFVGKFDVEDNAEFRSVELSVEHTYLVVMNETGSRAAGTVTYYGTYEIVEDDAQNSVLNLVGFGQLRLTYDEQGAIASMAITPTGKQEVSLDVTRHTEVEVSDEVARIFGTWQFLGATLNIYEGGELSSSIPVENMERTPSEIFISKAGTYAIYYTNQTVGVAEWKWKEEGKSFYYRWNPSEAWSDDYSGSYTLNGDEATFYEYDYLENGSIVREQVSRLKRK